MTDAVIRAQGLVKDYGRTRALAGVDLEVGRGEVFGFLGPNGAGKSTTIRILLDLLRPTSGEVEVLGAPPATAGPALRARIGYLPGELGLPPRLTAGEYLHHLTRMRGGAGSDRVGHLADRFGLDLSRSLRALSRGNRQKVGLVQAFAHRPELLVLDEPTSGLDPLLQHEFRELVLEAQRDGATVFLSSHMLGEVEGTCRRVAIIRAGVVVDVDEVGALRQRAGQRVLLRFRSVPPVEEVRALAAVQDVVVAPDGRTLTCELHGPPDGLLTIAAREGVERWQAQDRELEDLFMDFYRGQAEASGAPPSTGDARRRTQEVAR